MQELRDSIKRLKLQIMGIEKEEVHGKGICNIFNKIKTENFPNLKAPNRHDQNRNSPWHIIIKTTRTNNKERTLKAVREKIK
jgi:hypothetical protein